jgi:lipid-A-disaccharide synthase
MIRILVSAGDASGDAHTADLVVALRERLPDACFFGVGGTAMQRAGVDILVPQREIAVGGLVEVLGVIPRVLAAWRTVRAAVRRERPALAVLVDTPDFNIPLARRLRRLGVPVLYYIAPQVWAWRTGRVRKLARRVDRMAVILPFEVDVFAAAGPPVEFVGHPLVERLRAFREAHDRAGARRALGLEADRPVVLLLPGSRRNEIAGCLGLFLESVRALHAAEPRVQVVVAVAPTVEEADLGARIAAAGLPDALPLRIVPGRTHEAMVAADVALAKPGTVTVEAVLLGCPLVVAGRGNPLSAAIMRRIVRVPSFTLANLMAGMPVVPEFLQENADPERIAAALGELLAGPARALQLARFDAVTRRLGRGGAAQRTAEIAEEMIRARVAPA